MKKHRFLFMAIVMSSFLLFSPRVDNVILPSATATIIDFITLGLGKSRLNGLKSKNSVVRGINLPP